MFTEDHSLSRCSVASCDRPLHVVDRQLCAAHYHRWLRHGDVLAHAPITERPSEVLDWLTLALECDTDECIIWPFTTTAKGYPKIFGTRYAHIEVCLRVHGDRPVGTAAAHSCNMPSCVNRRHLSWKTYRENEMDKLANGTHGKKLTIEQVIEIRHLASFDIDPNEMASQFGVSKESIYNITAHRTWKHV